MSETIAFDSSSVIRTKEDLNEFLTSKTFNSIVEFVDKLNESVKGIPNSGSCTLSQPVERLLQVLEKLVQWINETPPLTQRSRFGNAAFCTLLDKVNQNSRSLIEEILGPIDSFKVELSREDLIEELVTYFDHCMGDKQRLDYGSGHELNFVMLLYCLEKIGLLTNEDHRALVLRVFQKYLDVMRLIQKTYWLEPAGSHGVWGLDDYQFLPFLWGSAQLLDHKHIRPKSICNAETVDAFAKEYMYFGCVQFINQVKTGSFFEHSPLLFDISGAKSWTKVNEGMVKMFKAEVLGKLPIMKHFFFGHLIPLKLSGEHNHSCDDNHHHDIPNASPLFRVTSCCVQKIPSAIGAKEFKKM